MSIPTLDERVTALEEQVARLVENPAKRPSVVVTNWRASAGMFAGDPIMKEIIEEGRKIRQQDREQTGK